MSKVLKDGGTLPLVTDETKKPTSQEDGLGKGLGYALHRAMSWLKVDTGNE